MHTYLSPVRVVSRRIGVPYHAKCTRPMPSQSLYQLDQSPVDMKSPWVHEVVSIPIHVHQLDSIGNETRQNRHVPTFQTDKFAYLLFILKTIPFLECDKSHIASDLVGKELPLILALKNPKDMLKKRRMSPSHGGVGTSGSERCHLHEDQARDALDRPVIEKTTTSDESRFNLSGDEWRPRGERLNPVFSLQRHIATTAGVIVWGAIAYNTQSPLVLIGGTMTAQRAPTSSNPELELWCTEEPSSRGSDAVKSIEAEDSLFHSDSSLKTFRDDQCINMEDLGPSPQPKFPDEQRCMQIKGIAKEIKIFCIRKDYVAPNSTLSSLPHCDPTLLNHSLL
ncbi:transposable element Tcb1 transposase [Trichonephila clavipes]|nr:transposable element Tcb1 transposase [Trichonephila clavipes]